MSIQQQVFTPVQAGAQFLGWAEKTSRNKLTQGKFPFPVRLLGGRRVVLLGDIEAVLSAAPIVAGPAPQLAPQPAKLQQLGSARRGRPTALESARALAAGITVKELRQQDGGEQHVAP